MPTLFTEGAGNAAFILTEANGQRSRSNATLLVGQNLAAGTVLTLDATSTPNGPIYRAWDGSRDSANTHDPFPTAILINKTDATAAAVGISVIDKDAEVNLKVLVYPTQTEEEADVIRLLALVGIIART